MVGAGPRLPLKPPRQARARALGVVALSYLAGSVPFTNLGARLLKGVDLRDVGTGTVSGTGLYEVAGFGPLAVLGCAELAKGAAGPLLARRRGPNLTALAAGAAVAGHNWSPFLGFRGGRGVSVALGASLATFPEGAALLGAGLGGGRLVHRSGAGCALAITALPGLLLKLRGREGLLLGTCLALPLAAKRLVGNRPPPSRDLRHYAHRYLFDSDLLPGRRGRDRGRVNPEAAGSGDGAESRRKQPVAVPPAQQH